MQNKNSWNLGVIFLLFAFCFNSQALAAELKPVKKPNVSGSFYPESKAELDALIEQFFSQTPQIKINGKLCGLISPHAGLIYSGPVASYGYKLLKKNSFKTIVILAPSHYFSLTNIAAYPAGFFRTPLGDIPINDVFMKKLMLKDKAVQAFPDAFEKEHSLEVQLPFLQKTLKDFSIVPLIMSNYSYEQCQELADALSDVIGQREDVLVIASSDMSHFHSDKQAKEMDQNTLDLIENGMALDLFKSTALGKNELCGSAPVVTLILTMKNLRVQKTEILKYATSADTTNSDKNRVVGYSSVAFIKNDNFKKTKQEKKEMLNKIQKEELLQLARKAINEFIRNKKRIAPQTTDPLFQEHRGAFVTIHKDRKLRGCIGRIVADKSLADVIIDMAIAAATEDPRFPPVKENELNALKLEISVLSPIKEISDINEIKVGTHGLIIQKGFNSGLLLPQVATEYGWNRREFLENTCHKAGLKPDDWEKNARIYIFSAEVFSKNSL